MSRTPKRLRPAHVLSGALSLAVTAFVGACVASPESAQRLTSATEGASGGALPTLTGQPSDGAVRSGRIAFEIRWPERTTQVIPDITNALAFTLESGSPSVSLTKVAVRKAGESTASISFDQVAIGAATMSAVAYSRYDTVNMAVSSDSIVVASASTTFTVAPNVNTKVSLNLIPIVVHEVGRLSAELVALGDTINARLDGVGDDAANGMSVFFGNDNAGIPIGAANRSFLALGDGKGLLSVKVPGDLGRNEPLCVAINGVTKCSPNTATRVDRVTITPTSVSLSKSATPQATTSLAASSSFDVVFVGKAFSGSDEIDLAPYIGKPGAPVFSMGVGSDSINVERYAAQAYEKVFQFKSNDLGWEQIDSGAPVYGKSYIDPISGGYLISPFEVQTPTVVPSPGATVAPGTPYTSKFIGVSTGSSEVVEFGFSNIKASATVSIIP
ncbi:MAG: hypothetical protein VKO64_12055 [Candidatus Sericytochromatia bacterium]|nr:hypothetical protein [Candidatus Sericytochromatia bacterium]